MLTIIRELEIVSSQRLILIAAIDPRRRFAITDPRKTPPSAVLAALMPVGRLPVDAGG